MIPIKPKKEITKCCAIEKDIKKIKILLITVAIFMMLEIWGHWNSNSLSLLADSIHLFVDVMGFTVSLFALKWTQKSSNRRMTFGYHRIEVLGALFSILLIWAATGYLLKESYNKYLNPKLIDGKVFLFISICGFFVNIFCLIFLHSGCKGHVNSMNLNIKAAYIHVIGDIVQSFGVILASIITLLKPEWIWADIACTLIFSCLIISSTIFVIKEAIEILIEQAPMDVDQVALIQDLHKIPGVMKITNLNIWSISATKKAACLHIICLYIFTNEYENILIQCKKLMKETYNLDFVTIQIETMNTQRNSREFFVDGMNVSEVNVT
ncbi:putative zinc transporter protein [Astathelohania contejeani]|uniref:Zinc transporter protein n=1 Tax=Astathelohania contejeani TaxID=164912 RepID=A0ABQ7HXU2_9MICR|nr:putative zinc transporter protein [Thelohania contejeani]